MEKNNKHIDLFEDELKDAEILSKFKGKNSFATPDNYFHNLESDITNSIGINAISNKKPFAKYALYVAAASITILMIFVGLQFSKMQKHKNQIVEEDILKNETINNDNIEITDNKKNIKQIIIDDSVRNNIFEPKATNNNIYLAVENNATPKSLNKKRIKIDKETQIIIKEDISHQNDNEKIIVDNSINNFPSSSISNMEANNSSKRTIRAITRRSNNTTVNVFLPDDTCVNSSFTYVIDTTDFGDLSFVWNSNKGISNKFTESGNYYLQYWLEDSLLGVDSINVIIIAKPQPIIVAKNEICNHESILLNAGISSEKYNYKWSVSDLNRSEIYVDNLKPGDKLIELEVSSCVDTVYTQVLVHINDCQLMIPNVFTPNGDGVNDVFFIKGLTHYSGSSLTILDRKGNVVYQSLDYKNDWKADNIADGTYFYSLIINDKTKTEKGGMISIIRK